MPLHGASILVINMTVCFAPTHEPILMPMFEPLKTETLNSYLLELDIDIIIEQEVRCLNLCSVTNFGEIKKVVERRQSIDIDIDIDIDIEIWYQF